MSYELPPFGWCFTRPNMPDQRCRHCGQVNVSVRGVVVCRSCDQACVPNTRRPMPGREWIK